MVPDDWCVKTLDAAGVSIIDGDRGKEYPSSSDFSESGYCVFLSAKNVTKRGFSFRDIQFIDQEKHLKLRKGQVFLGDIVLTTRGTVGQFAYYDKSVAYQVLRINSGMVVMDAKSSDVRPDFLYALSRSQIVRKQIEAASFGSAQPQLTVGIIKKFKVPIPPVSEQRQIAQILSTWDEAISANEDLLANSRLRKKALMQQLLTGKKRLPGFAGDSQTLALSEISDVIVSNVDKKSFEDEVSVRLCNYTDVYYNNTITSNMNFMQATASSAEIKKFSLKVGDVIITKDSETPGDIAVPALVSEDLGGVVCGYHLAIIRPDQKKVDSRFLNFLLSMPKTRYYFFTLATGATRFGLSIGSIQKAQFNLPPLLEQREISDILTVADEEIEALEQLINNLKLQKKALMQQLLTGKKRVKVESVTA